MFPDDRPRHLQQVRELSEGIRSYVPHASCKCISIDCGNSESSLPSTKDDHQRSQVRQTFLGATIHACSWDLVEIVIQVEITHCRSLSYKLVILPPLILKAILEFVSRYSSELTWRAILHVSRFPMDQEIHTRRRFQVSV